MAKISQSPHLCSICYMEVTDTYKLAWNHVFCKAWVTKYCQIKIGAKEQPICPMCRCDIELEQAISLIQQKHALEYKKVLRNREIAQDPCLHWCPNPKCADEPISHDPVLGNIAHCDCGLEFWVNCHETQNLKHHQWTTTLANIFKELAQSKQLTSCPQCHNVFEVSQGCTSVQWSVWKHEYCKRWQHGLKTYHFENPLVACTDETPDNSVGSYAYGAALLLSELIIWPFIVIFIKESGLYARLTRKWEKTAWSWILKAPVSLLLIPIAVISSLVLLCSSPVLIPVRWYQMSKSKFSLLESFKVALTVKAS